ncbi:MAG: DsbA family oxidoreductase [Desulfotalea sp.]
MARKINIRFITDIVCPWCVIGYRRLEKAIAELGIEDQVEIVWQLFELNPDMPIEGANHAVYYGEKYGMTNEDRLQTVKQMTDLGADLGFRFDFFDEMKVINTTEAHIVLDYAREYGKVTELKTRLFAAYLSERKDLSIRKTLISEVESVGLDGQKAMIRLDDHEARKKVEEESAQLRSAGVNAIPTVIIENQLPLVGAQPIDTYKQILNIELSK